MYNQQLFIILEIYFERVILIKKKLKHLLEYSPVFYLVPPEGLIAPDEEFRALTKEQYPSITEVYLVSNYGRVFNKYNNHMMTLQIGTDGYYIIPLSTDSGYKMFRVNRLVMITFCPIPDMDKMVVNHLDCNPLNNNISNLEWTTRSGNAIHAYDNGLMKYGEDGPNTKISRETAIEIAKLLSTNMAFKEIAETVGNGATVGIVKNIFLGHGWVRDVAEYVPYFRPNRGRSEQSFIITDDFCHEICNYFVNNPYTGGTYADYCKEALQSCNEKYNLPINVKTIKAVYDIFTHRTHKPVSDQYTW